MLTENVRRLYKSHFNLSQEVPETGGGMDRAVGNKWTSG